MLQYRGNEVRKVKIEIWTDFVCPFCYIGKRQLELALEKLPFKDNVLIEYKSFQIYPTSPNDKIKKLSDVLLEKYNMSIENIQNINNWAEEVELFYKLDVLMHVNTFDAHRFLKYACTKDKAEEVVERLLKGYFINRERIDDYNVLQKICDELSFDKKEVNVLLHSNKFSRAVKCDQIEADEIGIENIPFFLFNEEFAISGIQSVDIFKEALEETWDMMERKPLFTTRKNKRSKTSYCTGENCKE